MKPLLAAIAEAAGWSTLDSADVEGVEDYIRQLSSLDPDSFCFRYWHSKKGVRSLPEELRHTNLRHSPAELMELVADYLDGIDTGTSHLMENKTEMEAEWRNKMAQYMDYS